MGERQRGHSKASDQESVRVSFLNCDRHIVWLQGLPLPMRTIASQQDVGGVFGVPGMMYRPEAWCEDTRGKLNTARRSGRKSNINKAMATPVMACQEEA